MSSRWDERGTGSDGRPRTRGRGRASGDAAFTEIITAEPFS
jgi:hypothetical protein